MALTRFATPEGIDDLPGDSRLAAAWQELLGRLAGTRSAVSGPGAYVDPSELPVRDPVARTHTWTGFPRPLLVGHRDDRAAAFAAGEDRDAQVEYLEWHTERVGGVVSRVTFVTETPEYWALLARLAPERVLELYQELVSPEVSRKDLFPWDGTRYEPRNRWNTTHGAVHYVSKINSMFDLLGVSQERAEGRVRDGYDALPYSRRTAADARLNLDIWAASRQRARVATANPPGITILHWDDSGWAKPDGTPVGDYWRVVRGLPGAALRLVYEVPAAEGFRVGDVRVGGRPVTTGGQLAEHVTVAARTVSGPLRDPTADRKGPR